MKFFILAATLIFTTIQTQASCDWYNYNMMGQKAILETKSVWSETNEHKVYRIMNVQKQAIDFYLALKYSSDLEKLKQAPVTYTTKWNALYCVTLDHSAMLDSSGANIYLGFKNEMQKDLFYEFLKQEPALKIMYPYSSDVINVDEIQVVLEEKTLTEFQLEVALAKYLKTVDDSSLPDKLSEAVKTKEINLNQIPSEFKNNSQLLEYLFHPQTPRVSESLAKYFDLVGKYEKPHNNESEVNQHYLSTYAYLVYLKEKQSLQNTTSINITPESPLPK